MKRVRMRGVRRNMSWLELGSRIMKVDRLHPSIQNVARGATRRGMKWFAYRVTEVDKYRNRQPYGQWLWIPKANLIGHVDVAPAGSGGFIRAKGPNVQSSVRWERGHPLARNVKEVWHAYHWGGSRRGRLRRYGGSDLSNAPQYEHWLEAREVAKRERRTIAPWDKWRSEMSEPFHHAWWARGRTSKGNSAGKKRGVSRNPVPRLRFKNLSVGEVFVFASEHDNRFLTSGLAKGPWIKRSTREYEHVDDVGKPVAQKRYGAFRIIVGSVNADVIRVQSPARNKGRTSTPRRSASRNPRITIQFYRDSKGVIRHWGTGVKGSLPDRHVLLVDYRHRGIFDTWKSGGERHFDVVKHLDNPRHKRRR